MKTLILLAVLSVPYFTHAQVGIGTTTPSTNSMLDVNSASKGLMLPRISDTPNVSNPSAGLMIYDIASKTPAFHNGIKWNTIATSSATAAATAPDSITYTIANGGPAFTNGTFNVQSFSNGMSNSGTYSTPNIAYFQDLSFTKYPDANSRNFIKSSAMGIVSPSMTIEFKIYIKGALTPYFSVKVTNSLISSFSLGSSTGNYMTEQITMNSQIFGYKDWINNLSFAFNRNTNLEVTY